MTGRSAPPFPIRFGVAGGASLTSIDEVADVVRRAEAAGFTSFTVNDHVSSNLSPFPVLMAAAQASDSMLLGTLVLANDFRHPVMLAKEAATLDVLSGGRVELGLGAGWSDDDYHQMGIEKVSAGTRIERMADAVTICRGAWSGDPFNFASDHYEITDLIGKPTLPRPTIPICIGGGGQRVLTYAAQHADIVGINLNFAAGRAGAEASSTGTLDQTAERVSWVTEAAAAASRTVELQCRVHLASVGDDDFEPLLAYLHEHLGLTPAELIESPHNLIGSVDQLASKIHRFASEFNLTYWMIPHEVIDKFAPVIAAVHALAGE